jgi:hypothetical protein
VTGDKGYVPLAGQPYKQGRIAADKSRGLTAPTKARKDRQS